MDAITYADKDNTLPTSDARRLVRAVDLNEIKSKYNATIVEIPTLISTAISNLIGGAPGALDTLNELAAALADDADFAATVTTALAGKQPLNANLTTISGLSPSNDDVLQRKAGAWVNRTIAQLVTDILVRFKRNIIPTGTINGINGVFTFPDTPAAGSLRLYVDTGRLIEDVDYTRSGAQVTVTIPPVSAIIGDYEI